MPQGSTLALVVFPSLILAVGVTAAIVMWRRHRIFMESIRTKRAQQLMSRQAWLTLASIPEAILTSVLSMGGSVLIAYERVDEPSTSQTIVAQDPGALVLELLEAWCEARMRVRLEIDPLGERLRITTVEHPTPIELPIVSTSRGI